MRVAEYVLTEEFSWDHGQQDKRKLPAGAFVKPVDEKYVPAHVKEAWKDYMGWGEESRRIFAYSHHGFIFVPKKYIRAAE